MDCCNKMNQESRSSIMTFTKEDNGIIEGKWINIYVQDMPYKKLYKCSRCGRTITLMYKNEGLEEYPYCHCGSKNTEE